jgi:tetratricopeptide (TPR) repeat protein/predicted Ser/Thr protein kinase
MNAARFALVEEVFHRASRLSGEARERTLADLCGDDCDLRREVEDLLAAAAREAPSLDRPAATFLGDAALHEEVPGYRLLRRIGRGGSSVVYLAEQQGEGFSRRVALKIVDCGPDPSLARRLRAEQRILATLEHPGIARLYDAGSMPSGRPYLAMEYVEGETLLEYCQKVQAPLRARLELFLAVLDAVGYAHAAKVVHRDLKPGNILVSERGEPKLLDFGIAHLHQDGGGLETTHTLHRAMTPAYASPEQVRGEAVDARSDLYSLGVVLYELLTGRRPYRLSDTSRETLERAIREQEPDRPSTAARSRRELRGDLDAILLKALRKEPGARYASAADFAADLRAYLEGRPVRARRGSLLYRAGKVVRRRRGLLINLALVALLATGAWLWASWRSDSTSVDEPNASPWLALPVASDAEESYRAGLAALARRESPAGIRRLRSAAAADPRHPLVRAALAHGLSLAGHDLEARAEGQRALALAADLPRESRLLVEGIALRTAGKSTEAAEVYRSLWLLRPGNLEIGLLLAQSLARIDPQKSYDVAAKLRALPPPAGANPRIGLAALEALGQLGRSQEVLDQAPPVIAEARARGLTALEARIIHFQATAHFYVGNTGQTRALIERARQMFLAEGEILGAANTFQVTCAMSVHEARYEAAERDCAESLRLYRRVGSPNGAARVLAALGGMHAGRGRLLEAREAFAAALATGRANNNKMDEGRYLHNLAVAELELSRLPQAEKALREAVALRRETGDQSGLALSLETLASTLITRGSLAEAEPLLAEAETVGRSVSTPRHLSIVLRARARLAFLEDDRERMLRWLDEAAALHERAGEKDAAAYDRAGRIYFAKSPDATTCRDLEAAVRELQSLGHPWDVEVQIWVARCWNETGFPRRAVPWIESAAVAKLTAGKPEVQIKLALARADLALRTGRWSDAERWLGTADAECRRLSFGTLLMEARLLEARLALARGDHPERVRTLAEELRRDATARRYKRIARLAGELL